MPIYSSTSTTLMNNAPGSTAHRRSAAEFVWQRPCCSTAWTGRTTRRGVRPGTFFNQNLIQEIQIGGLGAPAGIPRVHWRRSEYDYKSGPTRSRAFSRSTTQRRAGGNNVDDDLLAQNENLGATAVTKKLNDYTCSSAAAGAQQGVLLRPTSKAGIRPTSTDRAGGEQHGNQSSSPEADPCSPTRRTPSSGRAVRRTTSRVASGGGPPLRPTRQPDAHARMPPSGCGTCSGARSAAPPRCWRPSTRVHGYTTSIGGPDAFLTPTTPTRYLLLRRRRRPVTTPIAAVTRHRCPDEIRGRFGKPLAEVRCGDERSHVRSQYQYYGPAGFYILALQRCAVLPGECRLRPAGGQPADLVYCAGSVERRPPHAQHRASAGPHSAATARARRDVYTPAAAWGRASACRTNLSRNGTSAIKAFWGRYYEGTATALFTSATPGIQDYVYTPILENGSLGTPEIITRRSCTESIRTSSIPGPMSSTSRGKAS